MDTCKCVVCESYRQPYKPKVKPATTREVIEAIRVRMEKRLAKQERKGK